MVVAPLSTHGGDVGLIMLTTYTMSIWAGYRHTYFTVANRALILGVNLGFRDMDRSRHGIPLSEPDAMMGSASTRDVAELRGLSCTAVSVSTDTSA